MLVPRRPTFEYALTCSDDDSQDFHSWLNKGDNNTDFLIGKGLASPRKHTSAHPSMKFALQKENQRGNVQ
jgi:hypothetical protein